MPATFDVGRAITAASRSGYETTPGVSRSSDDEPMKSAKRNWSPTRPPRYIRQKLPPPPGRYGGGVNSIFTTGSGVGPAGRPLRGIRPGRAATAGGGCSRSGEARGPDGDARRPADRPRGNPPCHRTSKAADCLPRLSPPTAWPASSASTRRSASSDASLPKKARSISAITSGPVSILP